MRIRNRHRARGAALMLSLWALFLLSAVIITWALDIDARIKLSGNSNRVLEAEAMACSGAEVALQPTVKPYSSALRGHFGRTQSYQTRITGEGGRININWIVAGENPLRIEILRKYLGIKGIDLNERDRMIDCLLDWVDADNLPRLNGAEADENYHPANQLLTRIEDLKKVKGWADFTATQGWDADFTLNSAGPIDPVWASRDVLMSLPGMSDQIVDRFLAYRRGPDKIDGTQDDAKFNSPDEVRAAFGFTPDQFAQLGPLIGFKDPTVRIMSTGRSADVTRVVQMVVRKSGTAAQLISWKEL